MGFQTGREGDGEDGSKVNRRGETRLGFGGAEGRSHGQVKKVGEGGVVLRKVRNEVRQKEVHDRRGGRCAKEKHRNDSGCRCKP